MVVDLFEQPLARRAASHNEFEAQSLKVPEGSPLQSFRGTSKDLGIQPLGVRVGSRSHLVAHLRQHFPEAWRF